MSVAFRRIDEFFVHSSMERKLYSSYFRIPVERFKVRLWSIDKPDVAPGYPLQPKPYVSAIGGNGRDYRTLLQASELMPHIPLVVVVRPENLKGITVPSHVRVLTNVSLDEAMNTLYYSKFTVLPLRDSKVPCGHVTLVCAMHLGKAIIATDSTGISDYVKDGHNGILCKASSPVHLADAIARLWNDSAATARLAAANAAFGAANCTEKVARAEFAEVLVRHGLLTGGKVENPAAALEEV
jgi:glycosyltransferase involved in cell wall biosynthesis